MGRILQDIAPSSRDGRFLSQKPQEAAFQAGQFAHGNNLQSNMLQAKAVLGAEGKQQATLMLPAVLGKGGVWGVCFGKFPLPALGKTK